MKIGGFEIGLKPFIIAEAGLNHCGSIVQAVKMIQAAKEAGADCIKFQTYKAEEFCHPNDPLFATFKQCEIGDFAWRHLKNACDDAGIMFLSTPQNRSDLDLLLPLGIQAIKVGSDDFCNLPLIEDYAREGLPMIVSTGMATGTEIHSTAHALGWGNGIFLLCTSQYPTPPEEARLARITTLRGLVAPSPVGFSDHTIGTTAAVMAVAIGACVFEKHFTLDHNLPGPDHRWACDPQQLLEWVWAIRGAWCMRGDDSLKLTTKELCQRIKYQRRPGAKLRGVA